MAEVHADVQNSGQHFRARVGAERINCRTKAMFVVALRSVMSTKQRFRHRIEQLRRAGELQAARTPAVDWPLDVLQSYQDFRTAAHASWRCWKRNEVVGDAARGETAPMLDKAGLGAWMHDMSQHASMDDALDEVNWDIQRLNLVGQKTDKNSTPMRLLTEDRAKLKEAASQWPSSCRRTYRQWYNTRFDAAKSHQSTTPGVPLSDESIHRELAARIEAGEHGDFWALLKKAHDAFNGEPEGPDLSVILGERTVCDAAGADSMGGHVEVRNGTAAAMLATSSEGVAVDGAGRPSSAVDFSTTSVPASTPGATWPLVGAREGSRETGAPQAGPPHPQGSGSQQDQDPRAPIIQHIMGLYGQWLQSQGQGQAQPQAQAPPPTPPQPQQQPHAQVQAVAAAVAAKPPALQSVVARAQAAQPPTPPSNHATTNPTPAGNVPAAGGALAQLVEARANMKSERELFLLEAEARRAESREARELEVASQVREIEARHLEAREARRSEAELQRQQAELRKEEAAAERADRLRAETHADMRRSVKEVFERYRERLEALEDDDSVEAQARLQRLLKRRESELRGVKEMYKDMLI